MASTVLARNSLKTRITFATLSIFLVGLWSLSFFAGRILRQDMERLLSEQQFATVSMVAAQLNRELEDRLKALEDVANASPQIRLEKNDALLSLLEPHSVLQTLFNGGVVVLGINGTVLADFPVLSGRRGLNYMGVEDMASAFMDGQSGIVRPIPGTPLKRSMIGMAIPLRDSLGQVIGALGGGIDLEAPNFLDQFTGNRYGKTGGYLLVAPQSRRIVAATDKKRVMETLPERGINPLIDRFIEGSEGSAVLVNPHGEEVLVSAKVVPVAGWYMAAVLPTAEAFAPIRGMQQHMQMATLVLTLLAGGLTWWILRRQFSPLIRTAKTLAAMSEASQPLQTLLVNRQDEIGQVVSGFNHLLATLAQHETALQASESRFRNLLQEIPSVAVQGYGPDGTTHYWNSASERLYGYSAEEAVGRNLLELIIPPEMRQDVQSAVRQMFETGHPIPAGELSLMCKDGSKVDVFSSHAYVHVPGQLPEMFCLDIDLTERKRLEANQRIAAIAFESQEGMFITDADRVIVRVNRAFSAITGYSAEEIVGQTMRRLDSGRHDETFFTTLSECLRETGTWQGELWGKRKNGEVYPEWLTITAVTDDAGVISNYVATLADITVRKMAEEEIRHLAFYDSLTGLPNRRLLLDRLEKALVTSTRRQREGALLYIDLDNFKMLNDTLGHDMGDLLLQQVALRLIGCVREGDTVARLGGDEFVVMLEDLSENPQEAATQAETVGYKILASLNQPYHLASYEHHSTPSIGVTLFSDHKETIDELLKRADLSMYQAKAAGRNTLRFFNPEMQAVIETRAELEADLSEAVQKNQLLLYYQAQVTDESLLMGAEALLRWQHPRRGLVSPAEFVHLSEETGLILPIGQWVLRTVCERLAVWAKQPEMANLTIAVNVSARQFHQSDFVEQVLKILKCSGADPQRLRLELTESLLLCDIDDIVAKMVALKKRGVGFCLDDFGAGHSSLSYLKRLPLDQLKIDRVSIRDILIDTNDAAIAKMIIALGESLGLEVIAEGVENEAQKRWLARQGCHAYQGFLFGHPLPQEEFEAFVRHG